MEKKKCEICYGDQHFLLQFYASEECYAYSKQKNEYYLDKFCSLNFVPSFRHSKSLMT